MYYCKKYGSVWYNVACTQVILTILFFGTQSCTARKAEYSVQYSGDLKKDPADLTYTEVQTAVQEQVRKYGSESTDIYDYDGGCPDNIGFFPGDARRILSQLMNGAESFLVKDDSVPYGDLAMKASEKINLTRINMLAFLKDLRHPTTLIPKLKNLGKLKTWADNYLTAQYGILPTTSDLHHIFDAINKNKSFDKNGYTAYYASSTTISPCARPDITSSCTQRLKLAVIEEDEGFQRLCTSLESWGLLPTFENVWDLIPYSFVIDWFVQVGDLLERVDTKLRLMRLNIPYVTMSRKDTVSVLCIPSPNRPYYGTISLVAYRRWVTDQCPSPSLSLCAGSSPTSHWLEGSALIIQRK